MLDRVQDLENEGYQFEAAEASFVLLVERLAGRHKPWFEQLGFHVSVSGKRGPRAPLTEATVKLRVGESLEHTVSEGDGPVNALDGALRKALERHYPRLHEMHLVDYKVRVINARAGTAARVRVVIESQDHDAVWGTVGVSENVIEASWLALVDAFEYKLPRTRGRRRPGKRRRHGRGRRIDAGGSSRTGPRSREDVIHGRRSLGSDLARLDRRRVRPLLRAHGRRASSRPCGRSPRTRSGRSPSRSATASATWSCT